jgi:hypothetical protein
VLCACGGGGIAPTGAASTSLKARSPESRSILNKLRKDVTIGSTVDPGNGDTGPRAISVVPTDSGVLKKGDILVCNFDNALGEAGTGTTIEQLKPRRNSKPKTFVQSSAIEGCDGDAITAGDQVYATGMTSGLMVWLDQSGQTKESYSSPPSMPLGDLDAPQLYLYSPNYVFVGTGDTGAVDSLSLGGYGTGKVLEAIDGFPINKESGWGALGPSGYAYSCGALPGQEECANRLDELFIVDGDCNAVVSIDHASSLLVKDEITVGAGCTSFQCKYPKTTCGKLVRAGYPLNKPYAAAILPNGNFVVANTGDNTLIELTPKGEVLATKVVDTSGAPAIWGLFATGTTDRNTALYYTDTNSNELHELER